MWIRPFIEYAQQFRMFLIFINNNENIISSKSSFKLLVFIKILTIYFTPIFTPSTFTNFLFSKKIPIKTSAVATIELL